MKFWRLLWLALGIVMIAEAASLVYLDFGKPAAWLLAGVGFCFVALGVWSSHN